MQSKNKNAVTERIDESLETAALPTQLQPRTASGAAGSASVAAGEEEMNTHSVGAEEVGRSCKGFNFGSDGQ